MANPRGIAFQMGGAKRTATAPPGPKKPISVKDLFSGDSDEEQEEVQTKKPRVAAPRGMPSFASAVPPEPADPEVKKVADKLAEFVAKNGRGFEEVTKERNPGNTPFKFLFDKSCADYKYYDHKVKDFASKLGVPSASQGDVSRGSASSVSRSARSFTESHSPQTQAHPSLSQSHPSYTQAHANTLMSAGAPASYYSAQSQAARDSIAAMNAYMQAAAKKEMVKKGPESDDDSSPAAAPVVLPNETAFDRRRVTAVIKPDGARGHHMQDFIPPEEMAKFLAKTGDSAAAAAAAALEQKNAIGADNIGHKLLQKMGWKEGEGIGASGGGITAPVQASGIKQDNLGIGATAVGEVTSEDDIYEQYRKRMMLGYKFRPNPLGNPRKAYY